MQIIPDSPEKRKQVKDELITFVKSAIKNKSTKGLLNYIRTFKNPVIEAQIIEWLHLYTPVRLCSNKIGDEFFRVIDTVKSDFDLGPAHLNPYYSVNVSPTKKHSPTKKEFVNTVTTKYGLSDREFDKKVIQSALSRFLAEPTQKNKNILIEKINKFSNEAYLRTGSPTVSGGLPSLGKNR